MYSALALVTACGDGTVEHSSSVDVEGTTPVIAPTPRRFRPSVETDGWLPSDSGFLCRAPVDALEASATLSALGYASSFEVDQDRPAGVRRIEPDRIQPGLSLVTPGDGPRALLVDGAGEVVHRWTHEYAALPGASVDAPPDSRGAWRKTHLLPRRKLLAIHEGLGLLKLDQDSQLEWFVNRRAHHDLVVQADGTILVLVAEPVRLPELSPHALLEDRVLEVSAEGVSGREVSLIEAFVASDFAHLVRGRLAEGGDAFHTNSLAILTEDTARAFPDARTGDWLVSLREVNVIAVVDPATPSVRWAHKGPWRAQHDPCVTDDGNVLLFDNQGARGYSRVLEWNPRAEAIEWSFEGEPNESFFSVLCGTAQRLANGNTLVTETCHGRAFELTREGTVVWEFALGSRVVDGVRVVPALFEVERL